MPRLIDANEILKSEHQHYDYMADEYYVLVRDIENAPTVDAEPVVRCKDCKFFDHSDFGKGEEYWCTHFVSTDDTIHCHKVIEDDFCSWGESREDETN